MPIAGFGRLALLLARLHQTDWGGAISRVQQRSRQQVATRMLCHGALSCAMLCTCVMKCTCAYICAHACMHACMYVCMHDVCMHTCMHELRMHACMCVCVCLFVCLCIALWWHVCAGMHAMDACNGVYAMMTARFDPYACVYGLCVHAFMHACAHVRT